jgi:peptidoglycan/LPS O-acetylase OafA/YrhL
VRGHLPALDGLRGIAVLLVLGFHFLHLDGAVGHPLDRAVLGIARAGWCGVDLFFVLSGFLITGILLDAKGNPGWLSVFWARRALRIFPLHYAYLGALFLLAPMLLPAAGFAVAPGVQAWFWGYAGNVLFALRGTFDGAPRFTAHLWSLAVEEQFYLLWPLVVALLSRRGVAWACALAVVAAATLRIALLSHGPAFANAAYVLMPCRMDALAVGGLVAALARSEDGLARLRRLAPATLLVAAAVVGWVAIWRGGLFGGDPEVQRWAFGPLAFGFAAVLVLAITCDPATPLARGLSWRWLRSVGRISYGLYVLHYPVFQLIEARGLRASSLPPLLGSHLPAAIAVSAVALSASVVVAIASYRLLEAPCLALKDRVPQRLRGPPTGSVSPVPSGVSTGNYGLWPPPRGRDR